MIYIFYHIYCNDKTITIVRDQIAKIMFSDLYHKVHKIYCFLLGNPVHRAFIRKLIEKAGSRFQIAKESLQDKFTSYLPSVNALVFVKLNGEVVSIVLYCERFVFITLIPLELSVQVPLK